MIYVDLWRTADRILVTIPGFGPKSWRLNLGFNPGVVFARTTVGRAIRDDASAPGRLPSRGWFWHVHQRWGGAQTRQNPAPPAWARTAGGPQGWKPCGRASREQTGGPPAGAGVRVVPRMTAA